MKFELCLIIALLRGISLGIAGIAFSVLPDFMHVIEYSHVLSSLSLSLSD